MCQSGNRLYHVCVRVCVRRSLGDVGGCQLIAHVSEELGFRGGTPTAID